MMLRLVLAKRLEDGGGMSELLEEDVMEDLILVMVMVGEDEVLGIGMVGKDEVLVNKVLVMVGGRGG